MAATGLHISIAAEKVTSIAGLDISNSILTSLLVSALLIAFGVAVRMSLNATSSTTRPKGIQNLAEMIVEGLYGLVYGVTNSHTKTRHFFPLVATFFLFILLNNWLGLVPGVGTIGFYEESGEHAQLLPSQMTVDSPQAYAATPTVEHATETEVLENPENGASGATEVTHAEETPATTKTFVPYFRAGTADLNTTLALGLISVIATQFFGVWYQKLSYFKKFINFSSPITFFIGILETVLELAKVVSFAFRLFGNIFAGEVLLAVITFLVPIVVPMPFYGLEVIVGAIQALVFAMLSVVFFNMATLGHEEH